MVTERVLPIAEVLFLLLGLAGLWMAWPPAALMLGGLLGVLACERASAIAKAPQESLGKGTGGGER